MDIKDKKKKSKFREFKNWVLKKDNPYIYYFVGHIIKGHEFDRKYRTPEVHGTSGFATNLLLKLQKPDDNEVDTQFHLTRVIGNIWPRLIEILNGENPRQISGVDEEFAMQYFRKDENPDDFFNFICVLLSPL